MSHSSTEKTLADMDRSLKLLDQRAFGEIFAKPFRPDPMRRVATNPASYFNNPMLDPSDLDPEE